MGRLRPRAVTYHLIYNPVAGRGRVSDALARLRARFESAGRSVLEHVTTGPGMLPLSPARGAGDRGRDYTEAERASGPTKNEPRFRGARN